MLRLESGVNCDVSAIVGVPVHVKVWGVVVRPESYLPFGTLRLLVICALRADQELIVDGQRRGTDRGVITPGNVPENPWDVLHVLILSVGLPTGYPDLLSLGKPSPGQILQSGLVHAL